MPQEQTHENLASVLCIHYKVSSNIIRNYDECWTLEGALSLGPDDDEETVVEIFHKKEDRTKSTQQHQLYDNMPD